MVKQIPQLLLFCRPIFIGVIAFMAMAKPPLANAIVLGSIGVCLLADILDGIVARNLNVSTTQLRVLDTVFDLSFYLSVLGYIYSVNPGVIQHHEGLLVCILLLEAMLYLVSLLRFSKFPSPHAFLSKVWGLYLAVEFILLIFQVEGAHFRLALYFGVLVHLDRVAIYVLLKTWDHDIPSSYHAWLHRNGKPFVRHKLLNG